MRERLEESGYVVLYADALEYLNPNLPIDISDVLVVLAGAFSDALGDLEILQHSRVIARPRASGTSNRLRSVRRSQRFPVE